MAAIDGVVDSVKYSARGDLDEVGFRNGAKLTQSWNELRELTGLQVSAKSGGALLKLGFDRLSTGLLDGVRDDALPGRVRHQVKFTQDAWERTSQAVFAREGGDETVSWTFDDIDNVKSVVSSRGSESRAHVGDLSYDGTRTNAVVSAAGVSMAYDGAGRLESRGAVSLVRDYRGRIVEATGGKVDGRATFADDERIERTEGDSTTLYLDEDLELRDGIATLYVRLGGGRVARLESDALAATVLSDLSGDDVIDISDAWLAKNGAAEASPVKALLKSSARRLLMSDATWLHGDHLGSLVAATGVDGELVGEQSFFPTGALRESGGFVDEYGFTGQDVDEFTGLTHFQYRDLDVVTGRWDQPDPLFLELDADSVRVLGESTTAYAYVANTFADRHDPDGLMGSPLRFLLGRAMGLHKHKKVSQNKFDRLMQKNAARLQKNVQRFQGQRSQAGAATRALRNLDSRLAKRFGFGKNNRDVGERRIRLPPRPDGTKQKQVKIASPAPVQVGSFNFRDRGARRWTGLKSVGIIAGVTLGIGAVVVGGLIAGGVIDVTPGK